MASDPPPERPQSERPHSTLLVVDDDDEFLDEAKRLFEGRVPTISTMADARRTVEETEVDLVLLGPSHAHDDGLKEAAGLLEADPELAVVLVATKDRKSTRLNSSHSSVSRMPSSA